ncbi:hypothetical protein CTAYLR_004360 [Chrysophaeum taylorii]|uniref:glutathione-disulfide reductase n=1 Tax=Chrysophaeum taylorii TaxID=2483200 RepID=A0AAD7ULY0_9STRA|nr:hypothetical protein CTAYLR_004360 [Chrysophaeum taylorii]
MFSALFVVVVGALAPRTGRICRRVAMSSSSESHFDYLVIGGGSGGIASARRAATYGAKVAVVERGALGGTCVNVGCVPKKVMWNAAHITEVLHDAALYQYRGDLESTARDNYVTRLNGIYGRNLDNSEVTKLVGTASFDGATAGLEGAEHCITSDGFFELEELPASVAVVGAGYIAVEMAGILNALGAETSLLIRGDLALRSFDDLLSTTLDAEMKRQGMTVVPQTTVASVALDEETGLKTVVSTDGVEVGKFEQVLIATGRRPLTEPLCHDRPGVYALGDVCGNVELTPMAIAAGRRLADRLFGGMPLAKADYDNVPTVVFSHPTIGTIGLTEAQARDRYGDDDVAVYKSTFVNLWYGPMPIEPADKPKTAMKLVCVGPEEKVVGLHVIGMGADEMLQGFGVAMKMGATKADFDSCVAIHPTAAEEFVTLPVWGMAGSTPAKLGKTEKKEEVSAR